MDSADEHDLANLAEGGELALRREAVGAHVVEEAEFVVTRAERRVGLHHAARECHRDQLRRWGRLHSRRVLWHLTSLSFVMGDTLLWAVLWSEFDLWRAWILRRFPSTSSWALQCPHWDTPPSRARLCPWVSWRCRRCWQGRMWWCCRRSPAPPSARTTALADASPTTVPAHSGGTRCPRSHWRTSAWQSTRLTANGTWSCGESTKSDSMIARSRKVAMNDKHDNGF